MRIAALVANLSENSIVRTYPIVKVLQRKHDVQIIGVVRSGSVFQPYQSAFDYVTVLPVYGRLSVERTMLKVSEAIDADIVYAFKPMAWSYGAALLHRLRRRSPIILDIEDFDNWQFAVQGRLWKLRAPFTHLWPAEKRHRLYDAFADRLNSLTEHKTVVSEFLRARYGGVKLPHGPDTRQFDPQLYSREDVRRGLGLEGAYVVLFAGTVRDHKGLPSLCRALKRVKDWQCVLAVVGVPTTSLRALQSEFGDMVWSLGPQPHERMPEIWLAADLVVLAQNDSVYSRAQVPGKVFEAMAMERPIVASAVSDLPEILDGCGWIVAPDDDDALADAIHGALQNPDEAVERGRRARVRCQERYSWDVMEGILDGVLAKLS